MSPVRLFGYSILLAYFPEINAIFDKVKVIHLLLLFVVIGHVAEIMSFIRNCVIFPLYKRSCLSAAYRVCFVALLFYCQLSTKVRSDVTYNESGRGRVSTANCMNSRSRTTILCLKLLPPTNILMRRHSLNIICK